MRSLLTAAALALVTSAAAQVPQGFLGQAALVADTPAPEQGWIRSTEARRFEGRPGVLWTSGFEPGRDLLRAQEDQPLPPASLHLARLWWKTLGSDPSDLQGLWADLQARLREAIPGEPAPGSRLGEVGADAEAHAALRHLSAELDAEVEGSRAHRVSARRLARALRSRLFEGPVALELDEGQGPVEVLAISAAPGKLVGGDRPTVAAVEVDLVGPAGAGDASTGKVWIDFGQNRITDLAGRTVELRRVTGGMPLAARAAIALAGSPQQVARVDGVALEPERAHGFSYLGGRRFFGAGQHTGTEVRGNRLHLAEGATSGVWVSPLHREAFSFNTVHTGVASQVPQGAKLRLYARGVGYNRNRSSSWVPVSRGSEAQLQNLGPLLAGLLQVVAILIAGPNAAGPMLSGISASTGILDFPGFLGQGTRGVNTGTNGTNGTNGTSFPGTSAPGSSSTGATINTGQGANPTNASAAPGLSASGDLRIISRSEWGARAYRGSPSRHTPSSITVHHSEGYGNMSGAAAVQSIQRLHQGSPTPGDPDYVKNGRSWSDIGYHFLIDAQGNVYEGRELGWVGAHAPPNSGRIGICLIGNFKSSTPARPQQAALVVLMNRLYRSYGISNRNVSGHRDQVSTDCPGDSLYNILPSLVSTSAQ